MANKKSLDDRLKSFLLTFLVPLCGKCDINKGLCDLDQRHLDDSFKRLKEIVGG